MYLKNQKGKRTTLPKGTTPNKAMELSRQEDAELYSETCQRIRRATWSAVAKVNNYSQVDEKILEEVEE